MLNKIQWCIYIFGVINPGRNYTQSTMVLLIVGLMYFVGFHTVNAQQEQRRTFSVTVTKGQVAAEDRTIKVVEGDLVELHWISDEPLTLHLHGYDVTLQLKASVTGFMTFNAHAAGRYPVAIHHTNGHKYSGHHSGAVLHVEVHPR